MENAPLDTEDESEKTSDKKKSRKSKSIGSVAVETKPKERVAEKLVVETKKRAVLAEAEPVSEAEAPTEKLAQPEKQVIAQALAEHAKQKIAEQSPETAADPEQAAGDLAVEQMYDEIIDGQDPEAAYRETMANMGIEAEDMPELPDALEEEPESEPEEESESPQEGDEEVDELVFDRTAEVEEEEPADTTTAAGTGTTTGGATTPPPPPAPSTGTGPTGPGAPPPGGPLPPFGPPTPGFNVAPPAPTPNVAPQAERFDDRANPAAMALFGGIIGYLIGRRRGRIKTEKKLLPIQKKLEKQVDNLQWQLQEKETRLRRAAAEKVRREGPALVEVLRQARPMAERSVDKPTKPERVVVERRRLAPEAHQLHGAQAPEHIGHMLISAESAPARARHERGTPQEVKATNDELPKSKAELPSGRRIETLNRAELLSMSEKIVVDGSSLRQIYETHLIGERGLRRLVAEHLRGGDLKRALKHEVVEREIDFERDPALRDMTIPQSSGRSVSSKNAALDEMIQKAAANVSDSNEEVAFHKARANYDVQQAAQQQKRRRVIDISLTIVITALAVVIAVLYFWRG